MTAHRIQLLAHKGMRLATLVGISTMFIGVPATVTTAYGAEETKAGHTSRLRDDAETLLKGNRTLLATVLAVTSDQIKVDIGEVQPRFLPLKQAQQKGFPQLSEGDDLIVVLNEQNLLVDYHPLDGESSAHTIIRGELTQNLPVGQETAVIKSGGKEQSFTIRSQARSKVAAIPRGATAVFLIDETNQISDVSLSRHQAAGSPGTHAQAMSPIKAPHRQVEGTVTSPLRSNQITIRTTNGGDKPYEVREILQPKIAALRSGDMVILLVDSDNKVIDVAIPPKGH
ncbi:MAG: hypothetical protein KIT40_08855 [Nitrospira sp.]|nr:hypothetical protein [Nitrospira sp.]